VRVAAHLGAKPGARERRQIRGHQRRGAAKERKRRRAHPSEFFGQQHRDAPAVGAGQRPKAFAGTADRERALGLRLAREALTQPLAGCVARLRRCRWVRNVAPGHLVLAPRLSPTTV